MKQILTIALILLCHTVAAQKAPEYIWGKNGGNSSVSADNNGNIWAIGILKDTLQIGNQQLISHDNYDVSLVKMDNKGNYLWAKQYGGPGDDFPIHIVNMPNGGAYISCRYSDSITIGTTTHHSKGENDLLILKLNDNGDVLWSKSMGGKEDDFGLNNLAIGKSGNVYVSATFRLGNNDTIMLGTYEFSGNTYDDIYVIKLNSNGDIIWVKKEGSKIQDASYGIAVDNDENIYNTGWFADTAYFNGTAYIAKAGVQSVSKMFLSKYDSSGALIYVVTPETSLGSTGLDVKTSPGSVYVSGQITGATIIGSDSIVEDGYKAFVIRYDHLGNINWLQVYNSKSALSALSMAISKNEDIYAGLVFGDVTLVKYDSSGNMVWSNEHGPHKPAVDIEHVCTGPDNDVYITGTYGQHSNTFGTDTLATALNNPNNLYKNSYIARIGAFPLSVRDILRVSTNGLIIYPNPNNGTFTLQLTGDMQVQGVLAEIINIYGQTIYSKQVRNIKEQISLDSPAGIYFLKTTLNGKINVVQFSIM